MHYWPGDSEQQQTTANSSWILDLCLQDAGRRSWIADAQLASQLNVPVQGQGVSPIERAEESLPPLPCSSLRVANPTGRTFLKMSSSPGNTAAPPTAPAQADPPADPVAAGSPPAEPGR